MRRKLLLATVLSSAFLAGCASWFEGSSTFKPTPLSSIKSLQALNVKWSVSQSAPGDGFAPVYDNGRVIAADASGHVRVIDALSGKVVAEHALGRALSGGAAVAGDKILVTSQDGQLLALQGGKIVWQQALTSVALEAPQVAGDIVVTRSNDGRLTGFSAVDGKQQWSIGNVLPQLLLRNNGSMQAVGREAVMVGQAGGRLDIVNPQTGNTLWQATVATPRGATELERISDLVSRPVFDGGQVCAVAYQGRVACFEAKSGSLMWGRELSSSRGIAVDARNVYATAEDGSVWAFDRATGRNVWKSDDLKYRNVSGPALLGRFVLVTDGEGYAHLLSNESGSLVGRTRFGGDAPSNQPQSLGSSALIQGKDGRLTMLTLG